MRLSRQVTLLISIVLLLVLLATIYISVNGSRQYLLEQMHSQAVEAGSSLAVSITPILTAGENALAGAMVDSIFERGHYQKIEIKAASGQQLYKREIPVVVQGVPDWFLTLIHIQVPPAHAAVVDGVKNIASVAVTIHPGNAYRALWSMAATNIIWMLLPALSGLLATWGIIYFVFKPLQAIERQAQAIAEQDYSAQPLTTKTPELKRLVMAMNSMAQKIEGVVALHIKQIRDLKQLLYTDKVTGLMNRHAFENRLEQLLGDKTESTQGVLLLLHAEGLNNINQEYGYKKGDQALKAVAEHLLSFTDSHWEYARINGTDFAVLLPGGSSGDMERLCQDVKKVIDHVQTGLKIYVAAVEFRNDQVRESVLSMVDMALSQAMQKAGGWHVIAVDESNAVPLLTATQWREKLMMDIRKDSMQLFSQPAKDIDNNVLHREVLLRVSHHGEHISTPAVLSIASRSGFTERLDRYVVGKVITAMHGSDTVRVVNVVAASIYDDKFVSWLDELLQIKLVDKRLLILEINEPGLQREKAELLQALQKLKQRGIRFAFDGVGVDEALFPELRGYMPEYIKLDGRYSLDININTDYRKMIENIVSLAHTLSVPVIAQHVETEETRQTLFGIGVDGVQGYYIGRPEKL